MQCNSRLSLPCRKGTDGKFKRRDFFSFFFFFFSFTFKFLFLYSAPGIELAGVRLVPRDAWMTLGEGTAGRDILFPF